MLLLVNVVILGATKLIDSKKLLTKSYSKITYTLDEIPPTLFTNKKETIMYLEEMLHVDVIDYKIESVNAIKDSVQLTLCYQESVR